MAFFDSAGNLKVTGVTSESLLGAQAYRTTTQSIPDSLDTVVTFDIEDYDRGGIHDNAVNPSRFTVPRAGRYLVSGNITFTGNNAGIRYFYIRKNGGGLLLVATQTATQSAANTQFGSSKVFQLEAGDYIEMIAYQNSGGALNVVGSSSGVALTMEELPDNQATNNPVSVDDSLAVYTPILSAGGYMVAGQVAGEYSLRTEENLTTTNDAWTKTLYYLPASYAIPGKTTQWRLLLGVTSNAADPAVTFTGKVFPITAYTGGAGALLYTFGTATATTTAINPGSGSFAAGLSSVVTAPAQGMFALAVTTSGTISANSVVRIDANLEVTHA